MTMIEKHPSIGLSGRRLGSIVKCCERQSIVSSCDTKTLECVLRRMCLVSWPYCKCPNMQSHLRSKREPSPMEALVQMVDPEQ